MDCLFCKIVKGDVPSYKLYEDEKVLVIMDAYPNVDGHTLVIPKEHYDTLMDIPDDLLIHINKIAKKYVNQNHFIILYPKKHFLIGKCFLFA